MYAEISNSLPNNQRQRRTCYALCHILYPLSAAHTSIFRMDSNSTSYRHVCNHNPTAVVIAKDLEEVVYTLQL